MVGLESYFKMFDRAPYGALVCDDDGYVMYANREACRITGYPFIELAGINFFDIVPDADNEGEGHIKPAEINERIYDFTMKDGSPGKLSIVTSNIEEGIHAVHIDDVTEHVKKERALNLYISRLELAEKTGGAGSFEIDLATSEVYASDVVLGQLGLISKNNRFSLEKLYELINEPDSIRKKINETLETGKKGEIEFTLTNSSDGTTRTLHASGVPVKCGSVYERIIGAVTDITERVNYEKMLVAEKNLFQQYIDIAGFIIIVLDTTGRVSVANKKCCDLLGYQEDEIIGKLWVEEFIPPEIRDKIEDDVRSGMISGGNDRTEFTNAILTKSGETRLIRWNNSVVRDSSGEINGILSAGEDITEQTKMESALEESEKSLREAELITRSGHFEKDLISGKSKWSEGMFALMGLEPGSIEIDDETERNLMTPESLEIYDKAFHEALRGDCQFNVEIDVKTAKGEELVLLFLGVIEKDGGKPKSLMGTCQDITGRKEHLDKIEHISYHDHLTGLYNRRFLEEEFQRLDVKRNHPLSVIMADVNGLKLANDSFGHMEGDNLLKNVAGKLVESCREDDIIARVGGDEFMILLPGTNREDTEAILKRIKKSKHRSTDTKLPVSIALGAATKTDEKQDMDDLFKVAEDAMYRNKLEEKPKLRSKAIKIISDALFETSPWEMEHAKRVSGLCQKIGKAMKMPKSDLKELTEAGFYHDIGKIAVREDLLLKKQNLSKAEMENIRRHSETGYRILSSSNDTADLADYVLSHHESWNGSGYPMGLSGIRIPVQSRIIAIAEAYDFLTNKPGGKRSFSKRRAFAELRKGSGSQFDPQLVSMFANDVLPGL